MRTGTPARIVAGLCGLGLVVHASLWVVAAHAFPPTHPFSLSPSGEREEEGRVRAGAPAAQSTPQAQPPQSPQSPQTQDPQEPVRLRISVTAVEIDAVVTGKRGRPVTDLRPEEFEVYQDGRKQTVVSAQYVPLDPPQAGAPLDELTTSQAASLPPSRTPRREDVRHTMAIVVDDLNLSFLSTARVREALKRFVRRDLRDGDFVSIIRTGHGVGRFQPFTTDRRALLQLADHLRFNLAYEREFGLTPFRGVADGPLDTIDSLRRDVLLAGSLGAVSTVIRGMREMPGRKSVVLVSDGWSPVYLPTPGPAGAETDVMSRSPFPYVQPRITDAMRRLVDEANRSFVVIYTLDARGVEPPPLFLEQSGAPAPGAYTAWSQARMLSDSGPRELAELGGGLYLRGNNDLARLMTRAMEDQRGYYLIGYQPDSDTFTKNEQSRARFNAVKVRVTRPGLKVRARRGFFGVTDEELAPVAPRSREDRMLLALHQPFASADIAMDATGLFWRHPSRGGMVRALLTIDPQTLTFRPNEEGRLQAPIEVAAALIDERGEIASLRTLSLSVSGASAADASLVYAIDLPIDRVGAFQLRTVVRDTRSTRQGSASEFIAIPERQNKRLALSGVMLAGAPVGGLVAIETGATGRQAGALNAADEEILMPSAVLNPVRPEAADPVRRRFEPGMAVDYTYQVYNAERDKTTGRPALAARYRLFREGQLVLDGPLEPATTDAPGDTLAKRKTALSVGRLTLADDLTPGIYDLEVAVTDTLGKKNRPARQWTSFTLSPRPASSGVPAPRDR